MESSTWVQNLNETVYISLRANVFGKVMDPRVIQPVIGK